MLVQTSRYHLARQLATLQNASLELTLASGQTGLRENCHLELLVQIRNKPGDLGPWTWAWPAECHQRSSNLYWT